MRPQRSLFLVVLGSLLLLAGSNVVSAKLSPL